MPNVRGGRGEGFGGAATAGRNSESSSRGARAGDSRGSSSGGSGGNQYAGYRGPIGTSNPNTSVAPGGYGLSSDEKRQYEAAKTEYANRSFGKRLVDFLSPIHSVNPQINQPASYAGGQYHHGINPGGLAAGLVGGAAVPLGGLLTGPLGSGLYNATGQHELVLTGPGPGFSTSYPGGGPGYNSSTGYAGPSTGPSSPNGQNTGNQGALAGLPAPAPKPAPSGAPFGPDQGTVKDPMAAFFTPKLPNHSLPQGYQSMFPNSLSQADLGLLYAQALK